MRNSHTLLRCALLGSAIAVIALTPAAGAKTLPDNVKRDLAVHGKHALAHRLNSPASQRGGVGPTYTLLHTFAGGTTDGEDPSANVTLDAEGNIYGNTGFGGAHGDGTIFKLTPGGSLTLLHSFSGSDGQDPDGGLLLTPTGKMYGTTSGGGSGSNGVLFRLSAKGKYKKLHDFSLDDGSLVRGDLIRDKDGNLYGTALFGGANDDGTVFKYGADGTFTVLHAFNGGDGEFVEHGVVKDKDGNLYGVTAFGGDDDEGTVFKLAPNGTLTTLHSFTGNADGGFLYGGLDIDSDGNVYGSTEDGGANGEGTVFKIAPNGDLTTLYNFTGGTDGGSPASDMTLVGGNLYGIAEDGGDPTCQCGVIYKVTMGGQESVLHTFTGTDGGGYSEGVVAYKKKLYGTSGDGANGDGVVFSVTKQ